MAFTKGTSFSEERHGILFLMSKKTEIKKPAPVSNLKELVERNAKVYGDSPLYYYKSGKEVLTFSYNQLKQSVDAIGTAFAEMGIMGKNIAVIGDAHPYYMATYYATINGGGAIIPLDKELDNETLAAFMGIAEATAVVYTESFNKKIPEIAKLAKDVKYFIPIVPEAELMPNEQFIPVADIIAKGTAALENGNTAFVDHEPDVEACAAMLFTSGTTGTSKCVMLSQKNLTTSANACVQATEFSSEDTFVSVLPMNHSYEVTTGHLALPCYGASVFLNDSLKNALKSFNYFKPTSLILVPLFVETIHKRIWKEIEKKGMKKKVLFAIKLSNALRKVGIDIRNKLFKDVKAALGGNIEKIVCGGAPLSKNLISDFDAFGITIYEGYGITECSPLVSVNPPRGIKLGSVGPSVPGTTVKIDKGENDETGEILVKGDNVMMGYYKNPEATAEVFTEDGWFRTGDLGYMDKDGYIFITGRKKNLIILSNGKNIFPEELEEHLAHNEIIGESVVIGRKNDQGEIVITVIVYPNPELTEGKTKDEILEEVKAAVTETNKKLPTFKHIQNVEIRDTEFEKTTTKKIKRFLVK